MVKKEVKTEDSEEEEVIEESSESEKDTVVEPSSEHSTEPNAEPSTESADSEPFIKFRDDFVTQNVNVDSSAPVLEKIATTQNGFDLSEDFTPDSTTQPNIGEVRPQVKYVANAPEYSTINTGSEVKRESAKTYVPMEAPSILKKRLNDNPMLRQTDFGIVDETPLNAGEDMRPGMIRTRGVERHSGGLPFERDKKYDPI